MKYNRARRARGESLRVDDIRTRVSRAERHYEHGWEGIEESEYGRARESIEPPLTNPVVATDRKMSVLFLCGTLCRRRDRLECGHFYVYSTAVEVLDKVAQVRLDTADIGSESQ